MTTNANHAATLSIVAYRPKPGKEEELDALTLEHVPYLQQQGLATTRTPVIAKAADGYRHRSLRMGSWRHGKGPSARRRSGALDAIRRSLRLRPAEYAGRSKNTLEEAKMMFANFTPTVIFRKK